MSTSYVIHERDISHNAFDDEVIVVNLSTGSYFSLQDGAAEIWRLLQQGPASAESLAQAFNIAGSDTTAEIQSFLERLVEQNLLLPSALLATLVSSAVAYSTPTLDTFNELRELLLADIVHDSDESGWPNVAPAAQPSIRAA